MKTDDLTYLIILLLSVCFGSVYRKLSNAEVKKKVGALVGLVLVIIVSQLHVLYIFLTIFANSFIICYFNKRYCHIVSFTFSFLYLIFFRTTVYFATPYPPGYTDVIQMILTLKLVGLAFEVNSAHIDSKKEDNKEFKKYQSNITLTISEVFYYGFNYIGVLTGPYYKYQTYCDHLHMPFSKYDNYQNAVIKRIFPQIPIFAVIYLISDYLWPLSYISMDEFDQSSFFYHYWYMWPSFLNFRMRLYIGFILSECICITGGMGVYPGFSKSRPGHGPTKDFLKIKEICKDENRLKEIEYDYNTVYMIDIYAVECKPTTREGMRDWNIPVQYWLASCIYKRFPSKKYRAIATMFVSGVWHGVYSGYYICALIVLFGISVEDIWTEVLLKDEFFMPKKITRVLLPILKMQFFSYAGMGFCLLEAKKVIHYYNSVYHWLIILYICLYLIGKSLLRLKNMYLQNDQIEKNLFNN